MITVARLSSHEDEDYEELDAILHSDRKVLVICISVCMYVHMDMDDVCIYVCMYVTVYFIYMCTCVYMCCVRVQVFLYLQDVMTRAKRAVHRLVQRVGFFGILLCASVSDITYTHTCIQLHPCRETNNFICNVCSSVNGYIIWQLNTIYQQLVIWCVCPKQDGSVC